METYLITIVVVAFLNLAQGQIGLKANGAVSIGTYSELTFYSFLLNLKEIICFLCRFNERHVWFKNL